jgi:hypothetical protein
MKLLNLDGASATLLSGAWARRPSIRKRSAQCLSRAPSLPALPTGSAPPPLTTPLTEPETKGVRDAARSLGLQLHVLNASTEAEIDAAFEKFIELRAGGLVISVDPFLTNQRTQIVALAARHAVPAIYGVREFAADGGLMSYGTDLADAHRQTASTPAQFLRARNRQTYRSNEW